MDLKQLEKLMKLAQKYGLTTVKTSEIEFTLSPVPQVKGKRVVALEPFGVSEDDRIDTPDQPSYEDLLFYSASGQPVPDPQ